MDDRHVRDINEDSVVTSAAYLLLYRRRHGSGRSPVAPPATSAHLKYSDPEEIDWCQKARENLDRK